MQTVPAAAGSISLLCSDGLNDDARRRAHRPHSAAAELDRRCGTTLIDEANRAGGRDNITALAFRLGGRAAPARSPEGATLIGPSAEEAGLSATEVRRRAAAAAARARREQLAAKPKRRRLEPPPRCSSLWRYSARSRSAPGMATARSGSLGPTPPQGRPLSRAPLRTALRGRALRRALREPDPDRLAAATSPRRGHCSGPALPLRSGLAAREIQKGQGVP